MLWGNNNRRDGRQIGMRRSSYGQNAQQVAQAWRRHCFILFRSEVIMKFTLFAAGIAVLAGLAGCTKPSEPVGPAQKAGAAIDQAGDKVGEKLKENLDKARAVGDDMAEAAKATGERIDEATGEAAKGLDKATENVGKKVEQAGEKIQEAARK
jgi:hypothetical protein